MKTEQKDAINKQVSKPNCYRIARVRNDSLEEKRISRQQQRKHTTDVDKHHFSKIIFS